MIRHVEIDTDTKWITEIYNTYITGTTISFETEPLTVKEMYARAKDIATHYPYLVAELNNKVVGFAYAHQWKERKAYCRTAETTIYIDSQYKRCDIGTHLMRRLIYECGKCGIKVLVACITGDNIPSIRFHERLGFVKVSHFHNVGYKFNKALDVVDMQLTLHDNNESVEIRHNI